MRSPRAGLLALLVAFAATDLYVVFRRSGIPLALEGVVRGVEVRREKHPGVDDVFLVDVDGRRVHLDRHVGARLLPGDVVSKAAWERRLATSRGPVDLECSADVRGLLGVLPVLLVLGAWLLRGRGAAQST